MKQFLDTSVLVASFDIDHERHERSFSLLERQRKQTSSTAAHCLAEVYSVLTGMPGKHRANADEAMLFLDNPRERLTLVALEPDDFLQVLTQSANSGIIGGAIYDALIGRCAMKARAETIYTWNPKDFTRLGADIAARVRTP